MAEYREMDVVRPPGIVMVAPGIGAGLDRLEAIVPLGIAEHPADAAEMRVERRVVLVALVVIAPGRVGLPDLDHRVGDALSVLVEDRAGDDDALAHRLVPVD